MSRRKPKVSATQRDKEVIAAAKYLKSVGLLSKQTKLHAGRYVSRGVVKKVQALEFAARAHYKGYKVPKDILAKARDEGYTVANGRIVGPTDRAWGNRLKSGIVSGVIPVQGGTIEAIRAPYDDLSSLIAALRNGDLDRLKLKDEHFMFSLFGNMSYGGARDSAQLLSHLMHYDSAKEALAGRADEMTDYIKNLQLFRVNAHETTKFFDPPEVRKRNRRGAMKSEQEREKSRARYQRRLSRLQRMSAQKQNEFLDNRADKQHNYRERLRTTNPAKYVAQKEASRLRSKRLRDAKKEN